MSREEPGKFRNLTLNCEKMDGRWYVQPVVWLGILILLASVAGCLAMIWLGIQSEDAEYSEYSNVMTGKSGKYKVEASEVSGFDETHQILGMPLKRLSEQKKP